MVKFVGRGSYKPPENMPLQRQVVQEMIRQVIPVYRKEFGRYVGAYRAGMPSLRMERIYEGIGTIFQNHKNSGQVYWDIGKGRTSISTTIRPYYGKYTCPECK